MIENSATHRRKTLLLMGLIIAQSICSVFFLADAVVDLQGDNTDIHMVLEMIAALGLVSAIVFEVQALLRLLRRTAHLEQAMAVARSAMHEVIEAHFDGWALSPSERDVAGFLVKGLSTADIATLRGSAEGTVKAQLNAIYRKSGTRNRSDLLAVLIDTMMAGDGAESVPA